MKSNSLYDIEYFEKIKAAQLRKQKRARQRRLLVLVVIAIIVIFLISPLSRIRSIVINNNYRYSQTEIKKIAKLNESNFTFLQPSSLIKNRLEDAKLFSKVQVKKNLFKNVEISITENKLLYYIVDKNKKIIFYDENDNKLVFDNNKATLYQGMVPELSSKLDDKIRKKLTNSLKGLDASLLSEISQIIYMPKSYDKEFFRFVMSGDKEIYLNTSLDHIVKVGNNYHNFAINTKYKCTYIEYIDTENTAIIKKCK